MFRFLLNVKVVTSSPNLVTLKMEVYLPPKRLFLQESHGVISQKTAFFYCHRLMQFIFSSRSNIIPPRTSITTDSGYNKHIYANGGAASYVVL
jgi:hypothetical protein